MTWTHICGKTKAACLAAGMILLLGACDESIFFFSRTATLPVYKSLPQGVDPATETVAEIVAVTMDGKTLVHTDSPGKALVFIDITDPSDPKPVGRTDLEGEPTSVAVAGKYALTAVNTSVSFTEPSGHLAVVDLNDQALITTVDVGGQPDALAVSPDGRYLTVAVENERDEDANDGLLPQMPPGFMGIFDLGRDGRPKGNMRKVALAGLAHVAPDDPEPEYVAINDHNMAVLTLQENNHIVLVDLHKARVVRHFSAGSVNLNAIPTSKGSADGTGSLSEVKREPDAVAWVDNNRFVTANEGDYEGGSRGFTIWRTDGTIQYDSGASMEHLAMGIGHYPAARAAKKGTEPEGVTVGRYGCRNLIFVGSERGNFVAVFEDKGPDAHPEYVQVLPTNAGPEGLLAIPGRNLFVSASEEDNAQEGIRAAVQIFSLDALSPDYPTIESDPDPATSAPIGWGALSGLAADPEDCWQLYAVSDGYYPEPRIYTLDVSTRPSRIVSYVSVTGGAAETYDLEGITVSARGGFWAVSEGNPAKGLVNRLIRISEEGRVTAEFGLPEALESQTLPFGFEGVAEVMVNGKVQVIITVQREWKDDPDGLVKLAVFDPEDETWSFIHYPLSPPAVAGSWVGLSEIVAVNGSICLIIERDNVGGPEAAIKAVTRVDLQDIVPVTYGGGVLPIVEKTIMVDLLPLLRETRGFTPEKVEGLALSADGRLYVVTDNDGVKDATGETLFLDLGPLNPGAAPSLSLFF